MIHGLWNTSSIFSSITSKLDDIGIEYFAPTLKHSYGMTSILDLTNKLNELILEKYGLEKEIDILGFSMGGIIGRYWLQKFNGYKRTRRLISIGSPHKGTLMAQLIPKYPFTRSILLKLEECLSLDKFKLTKLIQNEYITTDKRKKINFTFTKIDLFNSWQGSFIYLFVIIISIFVLNSYYLNNRVIEFKYIEKSSK